MHYYRSRLVLLVVLFSLQGCRHGNMLFLGMTGPKEGSVTIEKKLLDALKANQTHEMVKEGTLNFDDQLLTADSVKLLATALVKNTTVTTLSLNNSNVGDAGTEALGAALKSNETLEVLHLCKNYIGDKGASGLAAGLYDNKALKTLNLENNSIGKKGLEALTDVVASANATIQHIELEKNNFRGIFFDFVDPVQNLKEALAYNRRQARNKK